MWVGGCGVCRSASDMYVCVRERETDRHTDRQTVCVRVCVYLCLPVTDQTYSFLGTTVIRDI